LHNGDVTC